MAAINHTVGDQQLEFGINGFPFNLKNPGLFFLRQLEFPEKKTPQIEYEHIHKENKQILPYQPTLLKTLANTIYCMCLFQHVGKRDRTHARTNMVKIALRKLVAGILCGCVVLLVLVVK